MKPVRTLVLVASEGEARLLENAGIGRGLAEVSLLSAADFPDVDQEFTDSPGRQSAAPGMARHGFDPRESVRDARRAIFSAHVLDALSTVWAEGAFDRLVIAAPPKFLGALRAGLPPAIAGALLADMPKDLVRVPLHELPSHFSDIAAF